MRKLCKFKMTQRTKYLIRFIIYVSLKVVDYSCSIITKKNPIHLIPKPKKILLTNLAHMGDVINATSVLSILKQEFPESQIGFVVGSHSKDLVKDHPLVDLIYVVDHWLLNRSANSLFKKLSCYISSYRLALKQIKGEGYDLCLDLYFYIGKASSLAYRAGIPIRIGYNMRVGRDKSCGGNLLTHRINFSNKEQHITEYYKDLLSFLPINPKHLEKLRPQLKHINHSTFVPLSNNYFLSAKNYIILHPGTGASYKEWPLNYWKDLIFYLKELNYKMVITGKGVSEMKIAQALCEVDKSIVNLVNKLDFLQLRALIQNAKLLIGVDSLAGHLASELDIDSILIYSGICTLKEWAPKSDNTSTIQARLPCFPCYKGTGCKTMDCIKKISPEVVFKKIKEKLKYL